MKKDEGEETTNLVQTNLKTIAHNSHNRRSKNAPKRWKIQNLENGKIILLPSLMFDRFILIFSHYKVIFGVFNHFFEKLLMSYAQNSLFLQDFKQCLSVTL